MEMAARVPNLFRMNIAASQLAPALAHRAFAIAGPRRAMVPRDLLLLQLNKGDARRLGLLDARISHALVFESSNLEPDPATIAAYWPDWVPPPHPNLLTCSAVVPVDPFSFSVPPFSKEYEALQNGIKLTDTDAALVMERIAAAGIDPLAPLVEDEVWPALPVTEDQRAAIDGHAVRAVLVALRERFPGADVIEMSHNNEGYDIEVLRNAEVVLFVEVKGTTSTQAAYVMSEPERRFSAANASRYELHVVRGIDLVADRHLSIEARPGEVTPDSHGLRPWNWRGRLPL